MVDTVHLNMSSGIVASQKLFVLEGIFHKMNRHISC